MDRATAPVLFNEQVRPFMWRLGLAWDALARGARAAKFVMLSFPGRNEPLLPRPFSISDAYVDGSDGRAVTEILYKPAGRATRAMTRLRPGDGLDVLGLLGNGFPAPTAGRRPVLLAGGIGNAPFAFHIRELAGGPCADDPSRILLLLAGRNRDEIYIQDVAHRSGATIVVVTDDGSLGEKGLITDALRRRLPDLGPVAAFACGPTPMLRAVQKLCDAQGVPCFLSVEEMMACGYGVCNACVVPSRTHPGEYVKACQEGPVFESREILA